MWVGPTSSCGRPFLSPAAAPLASPSTQKFTPMTAPASVQELLDLVQKSGVADEGRLKTYLSRLEEEGLVPTDPSKLAGQLVRDGLLTYFQAEQILQGKWKRFSIGKYKV